MFSPFRILDICLEAKRQVFKKKSKLSSPILRKTKHHKDSSIAVADVGKLALTVLVGDVDGDVVEEASRAWHDVRGKLVLVQDGICLQGEEKKLGSTVGKIIVMRQKMC